MMFLYFISLMIVSLIERNIRRQMVEEHIEELPILPGKDEKQRNQLGIIFVIFFRNVHLALIIDGDRVLQSTVKGGNRITLSVVKNY